jgi:hypothetical protein
MLGFLKKNPEISDSTDYGTITRIPNGFKLKICRVIKERKVVPQCSHIRKEEPHGLKPDGVSKRGLLFEVLVL